MITILEIGVYSLTIGTIICGGILCIIIPIGFYRFMQDIYKQDKMLCAFMIGLMCLLLGSISMAIYQMGY